MEKILGPEGQIYYYDALKQMVFDSVGNSVVLKENLDGVKRENLGLYLQDCFEAFADIRDKLYQDCRYDREEDIIWS